MDMPHNILESPANDSFAAELEHRIARLVAEDERSFPVHPNAEASTHPMWKAHGEMADVLRARQNGETEGLRIIAVTSVREVSWSEFEDTISGNSEHGGFVADVERADGWRGRYSLEISFGDAIAALRAGNESYTERLKKALEDQRWAYLNAYDYNAGRHISAIQNVLTEFEADIRYQSDRSPSSVELHEAAIEYIERELKDGHGVPLKQDDREAVTSIREMVERVRSEATEAGCF